VKIADHVHIGLDEDGDPVRVYHEVTDAREAVESDAYRHEDVADYWPDVPLVGGDAGDE
jgi:hypothetical protein